MPVFKVTDPQGYEVTLETERWEHITSGHPEMRELYDILAETIAKPEIIKRDEKRPDIFYYYRLTGRSIWRHDDIYCSAVVSRSEGNKTGRVRTAHLVKKPRPDGELVWFSRRTS